MKAEKAKILYQSAVGSVPQQTTTVLKLFVPEQQGMSLGDYLFSLKEGIDQLDKHFGEVSLTDIAAINTNAVWKYIMFRYEEKANQRAIETELQLLHGLISQLNPKQKSDIVSLAFQAAQADGASFS